MARCLLVYQRKENTSASPMPNGSVYLVALETDDEV